MKKFALVMLVLACVIASVFALSSCGECEHNYEEEVVTAPTCTEAGVKKLTCTLCGDVKEAAIASLGYEEHAFAETYTVDKYATCAEAGSMSKHCTRCSVTDTPVEIAKVDHVFDEETEVVTLTPTLFTDGKATYKCTKCLNTVEVVLPVEEADTVISAYNKGDGSADDLEKGSWCPNFDVYKKNKEVQYGCDFLAEFSFFYNESWYNAATEGLAKTANGKDADTTINFRPFKDSKVPVAALNIATGNFYAKNVQNIEGSSAPDVSLAPGWHRIAIQIREEITMNEAKDAVVYLVKTRLFVDGECINDAGTWSILADPCGGKNLKDVVWVTATIDATTDPANPQLVLGDARSVGDNMARLGDLWRTNKGNDYINYYGFAMFDDVQYSFDHVANTTEVYNDIFETKVTPINNKDGYQSFTEDGKYVQFDLNGGILPTVKVKGTQVLSEANKYASVRANYEEYTMPWFQVVGANDMTVTPTREGYIFLGWDKVVDAEKKVTYMKALWGTEDTLKAVTNTEATSVFSYKTAEEWTAHAGMDVSASTSKLKIAIPGEAANGTANSDAALLFMGSGTNGSEKTTVASVATTIDGAVKYYVITASVKEVRQAEDCSYGSWDLYLYNGEDELNPLWANADGQVKGSTGVLGEAKGEYVDVTMVIDVENNTILYYVAGQLVGVDAIKAPATLTTAQLYVGTSRRKGGAYIANFALSVIK